MPKKKIEEKHPEMKYNLYVAESIGIIKGVVQGVEKDVVDLKDVMQKDVKAVKDDVKDLRDDFKDFRLEIKNELEPLKRKVYFNAGKIALAVAGLTIIAGVTGKFIIEWAIKRFSGA